MRVYIISAVAGLAGLAAAAGAATGKPGLQTVSAVENGLFAVAVADKIRRTCPEISGRLLKARGVLVDLHAQARAQGYSDAEIEAHVSSEAQKSRMRAKRDTYLAAQGVVDSDPSTYCAVGHAEIRTGSQIGALLRAR